MVVAGSATGELQELSDRSAAEFGAVLVEMAANPSDAGLRRGR